VKATLVELAAPDAGLPLRATVRLTPGWLVGGSALARPWPSCTRRGDGSMASSGGSSWRPTATSDRDVRGAQHGELILQALESVWVPPPVRAIARRR
jgi:hypothetical protein